MTSDEADAATGKTLREYIWLPQGDISPAADNDNEEGAASPPLPLALVTGASTATPALLTVHADHLNRPTRLTDATRATVWQASYDPFGQPVTVTGTVEQNLRFPGQYFLIESGMAYNWHRFYDPATGRYTQPDPLRFVDGPSMYGYVRSSPAMRVDPQGLIEGWTDPWGPPDWPLGPPGPPPHFPYDPGFTRCDQYPGNTCDGSGLRKLCEGFGNNPHANCARKCLQVSLPPGAGDDPPYWWYIPQHPICWHECGWPWGG